MSKLNPLEFRVLVVVQLLLSIIIVWQADKAIANDFPAWVAVIIVSAWFVLWVEVDRHVWGTDIKSQLK